MVIIIIIMRSFAPRLPVLADVPTSCQSRIKIIPASIDDDPHSRSQDCYSLLMR